MTTGDARQLGFLAAATENDEIGTDPEATTRDEDGTPVGEADHQADIDRAGGDQQHHHRHDV